MTSSFDKHSRGPTSAQAREIVIPHGEIVPVSSVKHLLMQASLAQLERAGYLERYAACVDSEVLERLRAGLASEWSPIELAEAHYQACEMMGLSDDELTRLGQRVGDRLQQTSLVAPAVKDGASGAVWASFGALYRIWARHYQGGSVQVERPAPNECVLELCGFKLTRFRYYRVGQLGVLRAAFEAIGAEVQSVRVLGYRAAQDEARISIVWR